MRRVTGTRRKRQTGRYLPHLYLELASVHVYDEAAPRILAQSGLSVSMRLDLDVVCDSVLAAGRALVGAQRAVGGPGGGPLAADAVAAPVDERGRGDVAEGSRKSGKEGRHIRGRDANGADKPGNRQPVQCLKV